MKTYKAVITMLILVFSLSPCSVKRNVLDIFDIQYTSGLNKVKTTSASINCHFNSTTPSTAFALKAGIKLKNKKFFSWNTITKRSKKEKFFNEYSGHTTGNSPPKYILFKRLKLSLV